MRRPRPVSLVRTNPDPSAARGRFRRTRGRRTGRAAVAAAALAVLASALAPASAWAVAGEWQANEQSRVRLVTPYAAAPAEGPIRLGLEFETEPGWHVYWKNSGDAGYPPAVDFSATPEVADAEILWPAPERYELPGDLVAFGYERHVVYPVRARIAAAGEREVTLTADLDYLVCEVDCVPYSYRLTAVQPLAAAGSTPVPDPATAGTLASWEERVPLPAGELAGVESRGVVELTDPESPVLEVVVEGAPPAAGARPELFLAASGTFDAGRPELAAAGGAGAPLRFRVPLTWRERPEVPPSRVELAWTVTGLAPAAAGGRAVAIEETAMVPFGAQGAPAAQSTPAARGAAAAAATAGAGADPGPSSVLAVLAGALLGGLLLLATPTVLPLAVSRLMELRPDQPSHARLARRGALATAAGCLAGALGLAAAALAVRASGRAAGWGVQLQEPVVVALLALAATVLALNLWGLVGFPVPRSRPAGDGTAGRRPADRRPTGLRPGSRLSGGRALFRGIGVGLAAAVLALPWSPGPIPGSIGAAVAAGPALTVAAFAALGLGLAAPYLAAALRPRALRRLPHRGHAAAGPGREPARGWGPRLSEALGFAAAGAVLWLLYVLSRQVPSVELAYVELSLLGLALAAWLRSGVRRPAASALLAAAMVLLAVTTVWLVNNPSGG